MSKLEGYAQPDVYWAFTRDDELVATGIILFSKITPTKGLELVDGYRILIDIIIDGIVYTISTLWEYDDDDVRLFLEWDELNYGPPHLDRTCMMPLEII